MRTHVVDALAQRADGTLVLIDVTRRARLAEPRLSSIWTLTMRTAQAMGMQYTVRPELSLQRARNVAAMWACRAAPAHQSLQWRRLAAQMPEQVQVLPVARVLGEGRPNFAAVWHLVAHRVLAVDLDAPIKVDTLIQNARAAAA